MKLATFRLAPSFSRGLARNSRRSCREKRCSYWRSYVCLASKAESPDVRKLAEMAQIDVTDEEVEAWQPQIGEIVNWFAHLQDLDLPAKPKDSPEGSPAADSRLRTDVPTEWPDREKLLDEAPEREGRFVKVPKIL